MVYSNENQHVTDEDRREFLKALGVGGSIAAGSVTLDEIRDALTGDATTTELTPIEDAVTDDLTGSLDAELLTTQQSELTEIAQTLPSIVEQGLPQGTDPRADFQPIVAAGQPVYDHLDDVGFFKSTTDHLPPFTPKHLEQSIHAFIGSQQLTAPLRELGLTAEESVDLVATVIADAEQLRDNHWAASPDISRDAIEDVAYIPPLTKGAAGGMLLWLKNLDDYLWSWEPILTDDILADAVWHARTMTAGFQLMTHGAKHLAEESSSLSGKELTALLSTGFAVQAIGQSLLPQNVHWVTEEMRDQRTTDIEMITESSEALDQ